MTILALKKDDFVTLQDALWREALHMLTQGEATFEEIDAAGERKHDEINYQRGISYQKRGIFHFK